jgi:murein L,D-transpeptidase YafK
MASAAVAAALALAGCETDSTQVAAKHLRPLSPQMVAELEKKDMPKETPILVRLFKEESELEVWKQDRSGRFALLKTYPVCRWSGELGPKTREGDRQAPEGFYTITQGQLNPNSSYYLSFDMGYPNAFDRAYGRTGSNLMVHGDCSSRGCYAMTDEQIGEIYALARESFFGGQRAFQMQAYPFHMTALNMARHRNNPNMPFWKNLKEGNDHFEVTRLQPKVDVCEKRYVFDAQAPANASPLAGALRFDPAGRCPAYQVAPEVASAVADKAHRDEIQVAELTPRTPAAPVKTGTDGGMNQVFLARLRPAETHDPESAVRKIFDSSASTPGTLPPNVNPPRAPDPALAEPTGSASARGGGGGSAKPGQIASASVVAQPGTENGNFLTRLFKFSNEDPKPTAQAAPLPPAKPRIARTAPAPAAQPQARTEPAQPEPARTAATPKPEAKPEPQRQAERPAAESRPTTNASLFAAEPPPPAPPPAAAGTPASNFDSRWSALR